MSSDKFQNYIAARQPARPTSPPPQLIKDGTPADDIARPDGYEAVRRIRSFSFADVVFRTHSGAAQAFPWVYLRSWLCDEHGTQLTLVWPEMVVSLTGRGLDQIEEDLMRRIIAEFRQVRPSEADAIAADAPVIVTMDISPIDG